MGYLTFTHQVFKGPYSLATQGVQHRLKGSANAVRIRAPQIGGEELLFCFLCEYWLTVFGGSKKHSSSCYSSKISVD